MNKYILATASTILMRASSNAQTSGTIKGKVVDTNNNPLISVTIAKGDKTV